MPEPFLSRLNRGPILCDGAMGTLLYAKGIFIDRCYDELNLSQPEMIRDIHQEYLRAGAEIIETNTYGANAFRLDKHGLAAQVREINLAGVRLAREVANGTDAWVAGAVGALGAHSEPLSTTCCEEAREWFRQQIAALVEGGVDLLILETFTDLQELHQAILAARDVAANVPLIAQVKLNEDGNLQDGASPETVAQKLDQWGADVIGCNCVGPITMMTAIERMARVTSKPLSAQANAGIPRSVEGRNIYLCSPEYMANSARSFLQAGAKIVGGCCGTTPEQIHAMKSEMRAGMSRSSTFSVAKPKKKQVKTVSAPPLEERSRLGARLARGEFITMIEIVPPRGIDMRRELEGARFLKTVGVDAVNLPDSPRASARMGNQVLATAIQQQIGIEAVLHYTCRDRNVPALESDLLGSAALGINNLLIITGDPPRLGNYPDATAVFDVDAIGLVNIARNLNRGLDICGDAIGTATKFVIGVGANPGVPNVDEEVRRFEAKVEAGAEYCVTQPVFDLALLEEFVRRTEHCKIPIIAGIWPLTSAKNAEFMRDELRVSVPDEIIRRMSATTNADAAREEGIAIAREMLLAIRNSVQGAQISAPFGRYSCAVDVLEALGTARGATAS